MSFLAEVAIAVAVGYVVGAIPSAYLAGRLIKKQDIRHLGDGNVGAENAYRELGPRAGVAVGLADIAKGAFCVALFKGVGFAEGAALSSGAAAVVGHNWPVFLQFNGGRGAATTVGALLVALFPVAFIPGALALVCLFWRRGHTGRRAAQGILPGDVSSTAACAALFIPLPLVSWALGYPVNLILYSIALPLVVGVVHFYGVVLPSASPAVLPADGPSLASGPDDASRAP